MNDMSTLISPSGRCTKSTGDAFRAPAEPSRVSGVCNMCKRFTFVQSSFFTFFFFNLAKKKKDWGNLATKVVVTLATNFFVPEIEYF